MQSLRLKRRTHAPGAVLLVAAFAAGTLLFPGIALAEDAAVQINDFAFSPPSLTVKSETKVTWLNKDDIPHTVASSTRLFKSGALDTYDSYSFTFNDPGTYQYFCSLHPHMTGKILVKPADHAAK
jgi:plastocyanin